MISNRFREKRAKTMKTTQACELAVTQCNHLVAQFEDKQLFNKIQGSVVSKALKSLEALQNQDPSMSPIAVAFRAPDGIVADEGLTLIQTVDSSTIKVRHMETLLELFRQKGDDFDVNALLLALTAASLCLTPPLQFYATCILGIGAQIVKKAQWEQWILVLRKTPCAEDKTVQINMQALKEDPELMKITSDDMLFTAVVTASSDAGDASKLQSLCDALHRLTGDLWPRASTEVAAETCISAHIWEELCIIAESLHQTSLSSAVVVTLRAGFKKSGKLVRQFTLQALGAKTLLDMDARIASQAKEALSTTCSEKILCRVTGPSFDILLGDDRKKGEALARVKAARLEVAMLSVRPPVLRRCGQQLQQDRVGVEHSDGSREHARGQCMGRSGRCCHHSLACH